MLGVDFRHCGERLLRGIGVIGAPLIDGHRIGSVADAVRHASRGQRIQDQHGFALGDVMGDDHLLLGDVGRDSQAGAAAHINDRRKRPRAIGLEQRPSDRLNLRIVFGDRDRNDVGIAPAHRRRLRRGKRGHGDQRSRQQGDRRGADQETMPHRNLLARRAISRSVPLSFCLRRSRAACSRIHNKALLAGSH